MPQLRVVIVIIDLERVTDSTNDDDDEGDDDDAVSCGEDSPADADADDAATAATEFLLAAHHCDLESPFLLTGIHASNVAQEEPTEEAPQTSSESDDAVRDAEADRRIDEFFNS